MYRRRAAGVGDVCDPFASTRRERSRRAASDVRIDREGKNRPATTREECAMNARARQREGRLNAADSPDNFQSETKWGDRTCHAVVGLLIFAATMLFPAMSARASALHGAVGTFPRICLSFPPKLC